MARLSARRRPERERVLAPVRQDCPGCGGCMRLRYENRRGLVTLSGAVRLRLRIRRCEAPGCSRFHIPFRPEAEGALALPQHEFGLDIIALVGVLLWARCATATTAACPRSTPRCGIAGSTSPSAAWPICSTAATSSWPRP